MTLLKKLINLTHHDGFIITMYLVYITGIYTYVMTNHINLQVPINGFKLLELTLWTGALYALLCNYNRNWINGIIALCEFNLAIAVSQYEILDIEKFAAHQVVGCVVIYSLIQLLLTAYYKSTNIKEKD